MRNFQEVSYYKHVSVRCYQRTHISAVEKVVEERERRLKEINAHIDRLIAEMEEEREKRLAERWAKRHPERNKIT